MTTKVKLIVEIEQINGTPEATAEWLQWLIGHESTVEATVVADDDL